MGRRLAQCLFQKHGEFRPTKRNGIGPGPFAKMEKKSGVARCLFLLPTETLRFTYGNEIGPRLSRIPQTTSGLARCLFLNLLPLPQPSGSFRARPERGLLGDFGQLLKIFE